MTVPPANWHLRDGAPAAGPLVIFDLDGVISDASHRQHFLRGARMDYRGFFTAASLDPPYETGLALAASVADDHAVAILTARPNYVVDMTRSWLAAHEVRHDLLILRPRHGRGSHGPSADYKRHGAVPPAGRRLRGRFRHRRRRAHHRDVPRRGRPGPLRPLRLLRALSPR